MGNKVLNFLLKAVGAIVIFGLIYSLIEYLKHGTVDLNKAIEFGVIYGLVLVILELIFDKIWKRNKNK